MTDSSPKTRGSRRVLQGIGAVLVLAIAAAGTLQMLKSSPHSARKPAPKLARLVEVVQVHPGDYPTRLVASGTVLAARSSILRAQVAGSVTQVDPRFVPGGLFGTGDTILRIDDSDYQLALEKARGATESARAAVAEEQGQQRTAAREYGMLEHKLDAADEALVLRKPQLAGVQAQLAQAQAAEAQARLNLQRTRVQAPFSGTVLSRSVELGAYVTPGSALLELLSTDAFWLELQVPLAQLQWLTIPNGPQQQGSPARVRNSEGWPAGTYREGRVLRLIPQLDPQTRLARLLVEIPDPLALSPDHQGLPRVLVDDYLQAELEGRTLHGVYRLERRLLRDGDQVWVMDGAGKLEIRPVHVQYRDVDWVLVDQGLNDSERLVLSDLATPVPGLQLRTPQTARPKGQRP